MALEDRCSPQSATSPPHRMPHSPHQQNHYHSSPTSSSPASSSHTPNGTSSDTEMAHMVSSSPPHHSPSITHNDKELIIDVESVNIKTEQEDYSEQDDSRQGNTSPISPPPVRFSITNILSDRFGKGNVETTTTQLRKNHLFRPYEIKEQHVINNKIDNIPLGYPPSMLRHHPALEHPAFTMQNLRLAEIYNDYSRKISSAFEAQMQQHPMTQQTLLNNFSSYPRIHEEILNSHKKFTQKLLQTEKQSIKPTTPPLGNLCKTVSQIGRPSITTTPTASISPKSDRSSLISPPMHNQSQRSAQDNAIDSSDDTKSETSSTTKGDGENGTSMWPAWVSQDFYLFILLNIKILFFFL